MLFIGTTVCDGIITIGCFIRGLSRMLPAHIVHRVTLCETSACCLKVCALSIARRATALYVGASYSL